MGKPSASVARVVEVLALLKAVVVSSFQAAQNKVVSSETFQRVERSDLWTRPWIGWALVYTFTVFVFFLYRSTNLRNIVLMYATSKEYTVGVVTGAISLGFLEDVVCTTYFACALWFFDLLKSAAIQSSTARRFWKRHNRFTPEIIVNTTTFSVSWLLYIAVVAPLAADMVVVRTKGMRFSFELVGMAIEERKYLSASPISREEIDEGYKTAIGLLLPSVLFAYVRMKASWANLASWNPAKTLASRVLSWLGSSQSQVKPRSSKNVDKAVETRSAKASTYVDIELNDGEDLADQDNEALLSTSKRSSDPKLRYKIAVAQVIIVLSSLVFAPAIVVALSRASAPLVAYSALNATLNELFSHALEPFVGAARPGSVDASVPWAEIFIHNATEEFNLLGPDTLYRQTTGFKGDLAFDVQVNADNPPNVLLLVVESFRFDDSHYLVGDEDPSNLFKGANITVTPNFDRWAKRGITLRNFWSSVRTSRALESLLFAQIPYDSAVNTGTTGGRKSTELAGLPQLFTAKGYETFFTTGSTTDYDNWDAFLPTHGFDTVWNNRDFVKLAESDLGMTHDQWFGPDGFGHEWGVHDDVSFQLLGDLLVNKTKQQSHRRTQGEEKQPLFLTHFTISSHGPFTERPRWYAESEKPDFSVLYKGDPKEELLKNFLEMRYFTDVELGKFMDRMAEEGVLNDTMVVIAGDHGGSTRGEDVSKLRVGGAIVAEGRLGDDVGLVLEDAAEHYDILNTLADITGVPEGGFLQDGVGRSLKRGVPFGERCVFSNDPNAKMSIVRGHKRLRYDRVSDSVLLQNTVTDHAMTTDLFPELSDEDQKEWLTWRDHGRNLNAYYTKRWDGKCLLAASC